MSTTVIILMNHINNNRRNTGPQWDGRPPTIWELLYFDIWVVGFAIAAYLRFAVYPE